MPRKKKEQQEDELPQFIRIKEAVKYTGFSKSLFTTHRERFTTLQASGTGGAIYFLKSDIDKFISDYQIPANREDISVLIIKKRKKNAIQAR